MNTAAKDYFEYRIIEYKDEYGETKSYLCAVKKNGELYGNPFEARTLEQVFAWLRLMLGGYPGTGFNDDNQPGAAA